MEAYEIHHGGICFVVHVQIAIGCPIFSIRHDIHNEVHYDVCHGVPPWEKLSRWTCHGIRHGIHHETLRGISHGAISPLG